MIRGECDTKCPSRWTSLSVSSGRWDKKCFSFRLPLKFHSFTSGWPVFPAPLVKEIVFFPLYILASFVKDKVSIDAWVYLWALYFVPLIYSSVFVPVPYCLDDRGFVVDPEVRQGDPSSSILLFMIALAIQGFLYLHTNCEIICSSSVKNTVGRLIGIALNL